MSNEKAIDLARKLKALADKGVGGEKVNAAAQLEKLLKKYGLTIEDVVGEKMTQREFRYKRGDSLHDSFVRQVIRSIVGADRKMYYIPKRSYHIIDVTDAEYIEISEKIEFYWKAFHEELDIFYRAFVQKNRLYVKGVESKEDELTPEEKERIQKMFRMMDGLSDHTMQKKLTEKSKS